MGITVGQSYGENLDPQGTSEGEQTNPNPATSEQQEPNTLGEGAGAGNGQADMTGTVETSDPNNPEDAGDVSAAQQAEENGGDLPTEETNETEDQADGTVLDDPDVLSEEAKAHAQASIDATGSATVVSEDGNKTETITQIEGEDGESEQVSETREADTEAKAARSGVDAKDSGYDPADYKVNEVLDYIEQHPEEKDAILAREEQGKKRVSILGTE